MYNKFKLKFVLFGLLMAISLVLNLTSICLADEGKPQEVTEGLVVVGKGVDASINAILVPDSGDPQVIAEASVAVCGKKETYLLGSFLAEYISNAEIFKTIEEECPPGSTEDNCRTLQYFAFADVADDFPECFPAAGYYPDVGSGTTINDAVVVKIRSFRKALEYEDAVVIGGAISAEVTLQAGEFVQEP